MSTGGPAFPGTLLDWFAGQALVGFLACPAGSGCSEGNAEEAYDHATAMLAEKVRREADHSGDANKMVEDHFRDAAKMTELEAQNRELVEALEVLVCQSEKVLNKGYFFAELSRCVVTARDALAKAKETKP